MLLLDTCDCGREVVVRKNNLTGKVTRSCGCLVAEKKEGSWLRLRKGKLPSRISNYRLGAVYSSSSTIMFTFPLWPVHASRAMIPFP